MKHETMDRQHETMMERNCKRSPMLTGILAFLLLVCLNGMPFEAAQPLAQRGNFYFDTYITVALYDTADESILDACFDLMAYYESIFSRTVEGSDIWNINHSKGQPVEVSDETVDILERSLEYCEKSGGRFDITIAPVVSLWDFHEDAEPTLPDPAEMEEALKHVDYSTIRIEGNTVTLSDPDAAIDLGAIAKGYISDGVRDKILELGCESALINLGGNVLAVGHKPDGSPFKIGIRKPFGESASDIISIVKADDISVITSGTYERYFELDGKRYHHILDVDTGYPVENGLTSVSILSKDGTDGDALSTTIFALGPEKGMEMIESLDGIEAMFIDENLNMTYSSGWPQE